MSEKYIRGLITDYTSDDDHDDDGYAIRVFTIDINGEQIRWNAPKNILLSKGFMIIAEVDRSHKIPLVTAIRIPAISKSWGKNRGALKKMVHKFDRYEFVHGKVQKKKRVSDNDLSKDAGLASGVNLHVGDKVLYITHRQAKSLTKGDEIMAAIINTTVAVFYNKTNQRWYNRRPPFYIFHLLLLIGMNSWLTYARFWLGTVDEIAYNVTMVIGNLFLLFMFWASYSTYRFSREGQEMINQKLKDGQ